MSRVPGAALRLPPAKSLLPFGQKIREEHSFAVFKPPGAVACGVLMRFQDDATTLPLLFDLGFL